MTRLLQIIFFVWIATGLNAEDHRIYIDGKVNGKRVRLALDTGADTTAIFRSAAQRLELKVSDPPQGIKVHPGAVLCCKTETFQLDILGATTTAAFAVVDMPMYMTRDLDGSLSLSDLNYVYCFIDPNIKTVEFRDALPDNISEWAKWDLKTKSRRLEFEVPGTPKGKGTIAVNTGSHGGVELSAELWETWRKENPDRSSTLAAMSVPASGIVVYEICWAKEVNIGGFIIRDVPVCKALPAEEYGRQNYLATLGLFVLSRLNVIVDKMNGNVYTRPQSNSKLAYEYNRLGAVFVPANMESSPDLIAHVVKGSPADKAGVCNGDILMKIDDLDTTKWRTDPSVLPLSRFWEQPTGTKIKLTLKRDNQLVETLVVLEDILGQDKQARHSDCLSNQLDLLRAHAEAGCAHAQNKMAESYILGTLGLSKNDKEAVKWLSKAADQNLVIAQLNMGNCYYTGQGVEKDTGQAMNWYRKAAEQNDPQAQYNMGILCRDIKGVAKDEGEMVKWYRRAADQNHLDAQYNLGVCYGNGEGVLKDEREAIKWYRKAAEQNHPAAQSNLGAALAEGKGLEKNEAEAVKWYRKAAEQNYAVAQYNLGCNYIRGQGVEVDEVEGVKWLRKAAEQGLADAQYKLALSLAYGRGVAKDTVEAFAWSCLASVKVSSAIQFCSELEKAMSDDQIAAGDRRTRALRAEIEARLKRPGAARL